MTDKPGNNPPPGQPKSSDTSGASSNGPKDDEAAGGLTDKISTAFSLDEDQTRANADPQSKRAAEQAKEASGRSPRHARLRLTRVDPWSVMKVGFLLSVAFGIVTIVAVTIVWAVLGTAGVWDSINQMVRDVIGGEETTDFDVEDYLGMSRVLGFTMLVAVIDVVLITAMATLSAFLYNMAAALLGGVELTLTEDEE